MARLAPRHRDETFHTPSSSLIDPDIGHDDDELDISTFIALSIPRVSDRRPRPVSYDEVRYG
ncbi:hypothetical protein [Rhizobium sp. SSA_523]|uniref:hypothetical protein n=1 Tax=Rhizobium sp. SSA_523 TaxID=2952477 RepID=UPI002090E186|nr:hypothetical protein [Rhizobium sp. SSA_523]MCO5730098.1 hypothetical protein [Rhizobium sp. SSA_523]WKC25163.1 hypothetical protein QTJ18_14340 [Rhizobium sp. SSA_523]